MPAHKKWSGIMERGFYEKSSWWFISVTPSPFRMTDASPSGKATIVKLVFLSMMLDNILLTVVGGKCSHYRAKFGDYVSILV